MSAKKYPYERGTRVRATRIITEGGDTPPDPNAKDLYSPGWIHALVGEEGVIEYIDHRPQYCCFGFDGIPTVRFDRTGTATIVGPEEIERIEKKGGM